MLTSATDLVRAASAARIHPPTNIKHKLRAGWESDFSTDEQEARCIKHVRKSNNDFIHTSREALHRFKLKSLWN